MTPEYLGGYDVGDTIVFSVQVEDSTQRLLPEAATVAETPSYEIFLEDDAAGAAPKKTKTAMTERTGGDAEGKVGLYFASLAITGPTYVADKSYLIRCWWQADAVVQVGFFRFFTRKYPKSSDMDTVIAAVNGTDSGAPNAKAIARRENVTN